MAQFASPWQLPTDFESLTDSPSVAEGPDRGLVAMLATVQQELETMNEEAQSCEKL